MKDARYYEKFYNERSGYWDSVYKADERELSIYAMHFLQRHKIIRQMISRLSKRANMTALDAGCGPGAYLPILLRENYEVDALDAAEEMLKRARENIPGGSEQSVHFHRGDVQSLQFGDAMFDLVLSVGVIMYVKDDAKAILELHRVLKPGGTLIIAVDNKKNLADLIDIPIRTRNLFRRIRAAIPPLRIPASGAPSTQSRTYSPRELKALLLQAGFEVQAEASTGIAPLLFNGRRIFSNSMDVRIEKILRMLPKLPGFRRAGYIYICLCRRRADN
jgi:ubiquinone/menaquinone biosynthesis C-methylase UbiE